MHQMLEQMNPDKKQWLRELPKVTIKELYLTHQGPPAKGEGNCLRCHFPKELNNDLVALPEFKTFLETLENKKVGWAWRFQLLVGRLCR